VVVSSTWGEYRTRTPGERGGWGRSDGEKDEGTRPYWRGGARQALAFRSAARHPGYNVIRAGRYIILMF